MKQKNKVFAIFLVLLAIGLLYLLAPILTPFIFGALLAYLFDPLVCKAGWSVFICREYKVPLSFFFSLLIVLIVAILLLIPVFQNQMDSLSDALPNTLAWFQNTVFPWLKEHFGINEELMNVDTLKSMLSDNLGKAGSAADSIFKTLLHSGFKLVEWIINLILIPVVMFYLLCDWNKVINGIRNLIPRKIEPRLVQLTQESDSVLSAFFRGQLLVMLALGILYSVGLTSIGLQLGIIIGVTAGILSIVPYLGFIVGIVIATIAAAVQFGTFSHLLMVWFYLA